MKAKNTSSINDRQKTYKNFDTLPDVRIPKKIIPNIIDMYFQDYENSEVINSDGGTE